MCKHDIRASKNKQRIKYINTLFLLSQQEFSSSLTTTTTAATGLQD
jgi:hypothetical protein